MKLISQLGNILFVMCLACSCGTDTNIVPDQRTAFVNFLDGKSLEYTIMNGTYRYIANADREGRATQPVANVGDTIVFYFEAYTFSSSATGGKGALYYSNKTIIMPEGQEAPKWDTNPVKLKVGSGGVISGVANGLPGCVLGDSVNLYITSDLAYGDKWMGVIPKNTPIVYILNVTDVIKP